MMTTTTTNAPAGARAPTRHQRTRRADPASLLSLFNTHAKGSTASATRDGDDDDPCATMKGYFDPKQQLQPPSWTSSRNLDQASSLAPDHRWSIWTNDSTLHPGLEHDGEEEGDDAIQSRPNMGVHMGIAMPSTHNGDHRSSIASSSSSSNASHQSSIPSSALSPYTPSSVDSQPDPRRCPSPHCKAGIVLDDEDDESESAEANAAIDAALSSTMKALEAANALLISTMSSRNNLTRLRAAQDALDDVMSERERELLRQIESNRQMADHMDRVCSELAEMAHSFPASSSPVIPRFSTAGRPVWNPASTSSVTAEARVSKDSSRLGGIVEALDENATVGKTAAKRLERMLKASAGGNGDGSGGGTASIAPPPVKRNTSDARSLLSSLAAATAASPSTSTATAGVISRRSSSQSIPSPKPDVLSGARSASSPADIRHRTTPSAPVIGNPARPELTRGRSSLSQAFGMNAEGQCVSDEEDAPVTPAHHTSDLPPMGDLSSSVSSSSTTSAQYTRLTPYTTTPTPSLLMHSRKMSHHHSPSVIKPSTASSALLSPEMSEWDRWQSNNPDESVPTPDAAAGLPSARGQGALAALKMLSAQNTKADSSDAPPTTAPKRASSSPRLRNDAKLSATSPEAPPTPLPTIQQRARSSSNAHESPAQSQPQPPQNNRSWSLSGWMKFGASAGSANETTAPTTATTTTTTTTMPTSTSTSSIVEHAANGA